MAKFIGNEIVQPPARTAWAVGTIMLSVVDPFELSETAGLIGRLIYWFAVIGAALVLASVLRSVTPSTFPGTGAIWSDLFGIVVFTVCFTPLVLLVNMVFYSDAGAQRAPWYEIGGVVLLAAASASTIVRSITGRNLPEPVQKVSAAELIKSIPQRDCLPALYKRMRADLQKSRILRLSMQDHYVEVHTDLGTQLILMRMSDAIKELDGIEGMQVHRSHWVAVDAVKGKSRENGRLHLVMQDQAKVPVSRSYNADVREAGLV